MSVQFDDEDTNYNTWVTLFFKLHCRAYHVDDSIISDDSFTVLVPRESKWQRLDDIIRTWIYGTISPALLQFVVRPQDSALDAWNRM